ncbi:MAG: group II intron reverse transcriptase/maturase [Magnetococcus sp. YQC-5]
MNTEITPVSAASPASIIPWHNINWSRAMKTVRKLQRRIAKAIREGDMRRAKRLQRLLTSSFCAKAMAVRRITDNNGANTPGTDGETWETPASKTKAVANLNKNGYKSLPLRRVFIKKANGKQRPLGIPSMKDRAMQALYLMALEPISETTADPNSYGFRPNRACRDAAEMAFILLSRKISPQWVLEGDIKGCFDNIDHEWLFRHIPIDREMLEKWLKSGFVWNKILFPTEAGTPQGGIISPVLSNMALDGMEKALRENKKLKKGMVKMVRYADDFIITGRNVETINEVKTAITEFLAGRGLTLSPEKTNTTHIDQGFDFLGWNFRKYDGKLLIKPSRKNVKAFMDKVYGVIDQHKEKSQEFLIRTLNPMITGWTEYHKNQVAKEIFSWMDHTIHEKLWFWAKRRHPNKNRGWIKKKYWKTQGLRNWVFAVNTRNKEGKEITISLKTASDVPIKRHVKIKSEANPYDPEWDLYLEQRERLAVNEKAKWDKTGRLILRQKGLCLECEEKFKAEEVWQIHHIVAKAFGGTDALKNLQLLHTNCHRRLHHRLK